MDYHQQNRRSWNAITPVHNQHKGDQAAFFRQGGSTLFEDEVELLGEVKDQSLVHLQCNCGQDSLSLAQLGASVTGVDISDEAVAFAQRLSEDSGIPANFIRSDLFDWFDQTQAQFDAAFSTYGTIGWLNDLGRWAHGVAKVLRPGGRVALLEFHPVIWSITNNGLDGDPYFTRDPLPEEKGVRDYVGKSLAPSGFVESKQEFANPEPAYGFQWTVADILQAVIDAGLQPTKVREYPYANGCVIFDGMKPLENRRYTVPDGMASMPLMFGLVATKV